jgi:CRISPR-associated protein Csd2
MNEPIKNRYEFLYLFDVENGNPNGDPDAGNMPRIDPETSIGIITDVCLKRKIRNYICIRKEEKPPFDIFVKDGVILNQQIEKAYEMSDGVKKALEDWKKWEKDKKKVEKPKKHYEDVAKDWMCSNFFDVRAFGAVMSTGSKGEEGESKIRKTAGQVRGPVQINFSKSVEQIYPMNYSLSVCAARSEENEDQKGLGPRKGIVHYGLYRAEGYVSAHLGQQTGFSEDDLALLWEALKNMFDHDHSAARGKMCARRLYVFKHDTPLGNAPAHKLFELVKVKPCEGKPSRSFTDYESGLSAPADGPIPGFTGVTMITML